MNKTNRKEAKKLNEIVVVDAMDMDMVYDYESLN